jgi:hypothetical protein
MRSRKLHFGVATLLALSLASTAYATVMVEVPLDDLVRSADTIVHGRVVSSRVRVAMQPGGTLEPQTVTTIRVLEWIAGEGGETVTLRELGGTWQGGTVRYEGTPEYRAGEEVIVFLARRPEEPHDLRTLGMVQGKFVVRHGVPGVPDSVSRELDGISFARWADGRQTISAPGRELAMELQTFLEHVRRVRGERGHHPIGEGGSVLGGEP